MDIRNSFSRFKKKVKYRGGGRKPGGTGAGVDGESANPTNPPPRPGPYYVMADDGDRNGADADGQQAGSTDQSPRTDEPEPAPAKRGENDEGGGEVDIEGGKVGSIHSHPHPDGEVEAGSGPGREGSGTCGEEDGKFYRRSSTQTPHSEEPHGALTWFFKLLPSPIPQAI